EIELLRFEISALSSGNLATNLTLENINTNSTLQDKENETTPVQNKNFFSKYFYTLFNNMF
ncbi:unnamed protein product, partial [marine sediment metagenome]